MRTKPSRALSYALLVVAAFAARAALHAALCAPPAPWAAPLLVLAVAGAAAIAHDMLRAPVAAAAAPAAAARAAPAAPAAPLVFPRSLEPREECVLRKPRRRAAGDGRATRRDSGRARRPRDNTATRAR